jgi:GDPmannose 4,6-dehydratase
MERILFINPEQAYGLGHKMTQKTALITGVTGQDGAYLAQLLLSKNYRVVGTSRDVQMSSLSNLKRLGIQGKLQLHSLAVNDFRSVIQAFRKFAPDEIYNLAGQSSVGLSFEQPIETFESVTLGTLHLLEAVRFMEKPVKLYNACSSECFGNTPEPANEKTPFRPESPYGAAKAAAFWSVANYREAYGIFACSGILFNHESPLRPERFVTQKIISAVRRIADGSKETLELGNISIRRDWGWAPEYVEAMHRMLEQSVPKDYVVATGETHSLEEFVATAFEAKGLDYRKHIRVNEDLFRPTDLKTSHGNPTRAAEELGWKAQTMMKDVVRMMLDA